jgi:hypothetical protein
MSEPTDKLTDAERKARRKDRRRQTWETVKDVATFLVGIIGAIQYAREHKDRSKP